MPCWSVNSLIFSREKLHERSSEKSYELTDQQDMFCFNHASAFYMSINIVKMISKKFKAQTPKILPEITVANF